MAVSVDDWGWGLSERGFGLRPRRARGCIRPKFVYALSLPPTGSPTGKNVV